MGRRAILLGGPVTSLLLATPPGRGPSDSGDGPWKAPSPENADEIDDSAPCWMTQLGPGLVVRQRTDWLGREGKGHWSERDAAEVQAQSEEFGLRFHSLMLPLGRLIDCMIGSADLHIRSTCASLASVSAAAGPLIQGHSSSNFAVQ